MFLPKGQSHPSFVPNPHHFAAFPRTLAQPRHALPLERPGIVLLLPPGQIRQHQRKEALPSQIDRKEAARRPTDFSLHRIMRCAFKVMAVPDIKIKRDEGRGPARIHPPTQNTNPSDTQ